MKKIFFLSFLFFASTSSWSQNLVPNGDFEQFYHCPNNVNDIDSAKFWSNPNINTPNYFNQCSSGTATLPATAFGYQLPHSGAAYAGIYQYWSTVNNYREYIETSINTPLIQNECYHFEMYISSADFGKYSSHNIGVYFSDTLVQNSPLSLLSVFTPQITNAPNNYPDTSNWILVSGDYTAHGGENYLIVGNYASDLIMDTTNVNPTGYDMSYVFIDDVSLIACSSVDVNEIAESNLIKVYPNPANSFITVITKTNSKSYQLKNVLGQLVLSGTLTSTQQIDIASLPSGIYFLQIDTAVLKIQKN